MLESQLNKLQIFINKAVINLQKGDTEQAKVYFNLASGIMRDIEIKMENK